MDIILQGREVCSSPLARSFHSTATDCSPCPVPGCAGEEDPPNTIPGPLQQTLQTPFLAHLMLNLKLKLESWEKGDRLSKMAIPLHLCFHLQAALCEWERPLVRTDYHMACFLGQMKQCRLTNPVYLIVPARTLHDSPLPMSRLSVPNPAQSQWPSLVPGTYLGTTATDRTIPAHLSACPEPSSVMGNCLHPNVLQVADDNSTKLAIEDKIWSEFLETYDADYNFTDVEAAAPCHSCILLDDSSLPFFILASVLGILISGAVLYAFLRPLFPRQVYQNWSILVQLAVGSALFSIMVPILARGLSGALITSLCHLAHLVSYGSAFAQALLIGCHACLGPKLGIGHVPGLRLGISVGLWGVAALLSLPITLGSDTSHGLCTVTFSGEWEILRYIHAAACFAIFILLPLGLLGAKGLKKALGRGPCPWVNILYVWFIFWWPQGMVLGLDSLVRSRAMVVSTCLAQQTLDMLLDLAEALAILHCVATPLLLAQFCYQAIQTSLPSLPLSATQSSHLDILGCKS
ncbi:atypical chemokine receptor 1 isoform X1 [Delphinapterus leucas]|uniref:Atypical chemokine receptor 1 n=2 Tax=Delphinapterus leucas TaxID=9749 RepID=A0A2Y9M263_DELLE|nr:atypical chemokine receptor 1 isoform X1 [Delphinapterus leucas]